LLSGGKCRKEVDYRAIRVLLHDRALRDIKIRDIKIELG
jgi:hypothetical protein